MTAGVRIDIDVDDLGRGVAFHTAALGLRTGRKFRAVARCRQLKEHRGT